MEAVMREHFANPSAVHTEGSAAREMINTYRLKLARLLGVRQEEVTFTSGGTESNHLAIAGVIEHALAHTHAGDIEVITTPIEHPSVLETLRAFAARGVRVVYAPVGEDGRIVIESFKKLLSPQTRLVTFAYVNSEVGVVQDVKKLTHIIRTYKKEHPDAKLHVHLDASQAPLWLPCRMDSLGVDMMTLDSGKCYGPKSGVLVHKRNVSLSPTLRGGDQERGLRAGTENTSSIVGCVESLLWAQDEWKARSTRVSLIRDYGIEQLLKEIPGAQLNGSPEHRVANNIHLSIDGIDGEYAVVYLDSKGIAASTRSACEGGKGGGSHVVQALRPGTSGTNTVRLTLGEETTKGDIDRVVSTLRTFVTERSFDVR